MREGWKKVVSAMLCAAMVVSMSGLAVSADGENNDLTGNNLTNDKEDGNGPAAPAANNGIMPMNADNVIDTEGELREALNGNAQEIVISGSISLTSPLTISRKVTIKGENGATLTASDSVSGNFITITASDVQLSNLSVNANKKGNYAVHFYNVTGGSLSDVNVTGSKGCSVLANASEVTINGGSIEKGPWGYVEYGIGAAQGLSLPKLTIDNTNVKVYIDQTTVNRAIEKSNDNVGAAVKAINEAVNVDGFELVVDSDGDIVSTDGTNPNPGSNGAVIVDGVSYTDFGAAVTANAIQENSQISLSADTTCAGKITLPEGVTLDGNGHTLTLTRTVANGAFVETTSDGVTIQSITIDTDENAKHGVQFYNCTNGTLTSAIINGGRYTSVIVNGAEVTINGCALNPDDGAYTNIEYALGNDSLTTVPELEVNNTTGKSGIPLVYTDEDTIRRLISKVDGIDADSTDQEAVDALYGNYIKGNTVTPIGVGHPTTASGQAPIIITPTDLRPVPTPTPDDTTPSRPSGNHSTGNSSSSSSSSSNSGSHSLTPEQSKQQAIDAMWKRAINKINAAKEGSRLKIYMGINEEIPDYVLDALRENNVTVTFYNQDGEEVTIPAGMAPQSLRSSWTLKQLGNYVLGLDAQGTETEEAEQATQESQPEAEQATAGAETGKPNPETGDASAAMMAIAAAAASLCGVVLLSNKRK